MTKLLIILICSSGLAFATTCSTNNCVQYASNNDASGTTHTTFAATFSANVRAGNTLTFMHGYSGASLSPTVTDTLGNTFTCNTEVTNLQPIAGQFCRSLNITTSGADTITANYGTPVSFNFAIVEEINNTLSFDVLITGTGTYSTTATSTAFTTAATNDIVVAAIYSGATLSGAGTCCTIRTNGTTNGYGNEDGVIPSAGSNTVTFAVTGSGGGVIVGGSFKVAAGASLLLSQ